MKSKNHCPIFMVSSLLMSNPGCVCVLVGFVGGGVGVNRIFQWLRIRSMFFTKISEEKIAWNSFAMSYVDLQMFLSA